MTIPKQQVPQFPSQLLASKSEGAGGTQYLKVPIKRPLTDLCQPPAVAAVVPEVPKSDRNSAPIAALVPTGENGNLQRLLPRGLDAQIRLVRTSSDRNFVVVSEHGNACALAIRSKKLNALILDGARAEGRLLKKADLIEINDALDAFTERYGESAEVWLRVAPLGNGVEIDVGDDQHTRIRITAGQTEVVTAGSDTIFYRTRSTKAMAMPATDGDWRLLEKYLNVSPSDAVLLIAWLTYTLAHPKVASSKYPILVLAGNEGSGKSTLCKNIIIRIIDPSELGVQVFPHNAKDLAIAGQNAHVVCFDNVRSFRASMADMLCIASTGGSLTTRQLYTDAEQQAICLHVAVVLNGIHSFICTPDLSQRCLPIQLIAMDKAGRKSEQDIARDLEAELPVIMRGLFDLIASIFHHLPSTEITNPERMIDFVRWLGAMELATSVPSGVYQGLYSEALSQGQLDTLMDNPLAAAIIEFMDDVKGDVWSDTPSELLIALRRKIDRGTEFSREWPQNPIALSKRLSGLQAGLLSQGIAIELSRGKRRVVTLSKVRG